MYNDKWLRFTHWAAQQGIDSLGLTAAQIANFLYFLFESHGLSPQMVKVYRTCLASILSYIGRETLVQYRIISDMVSSMELHLDSRQFFQNGSLVLSWRLRANLPTYISFYPRDLCPQADRICMAGPVVAAGVGVTLSS